MKEQQEGRPQGELTTENRTNQKQEQQGGDDRPRDVLVKQLQGYVKEQEKIFGEFLTREEIIRLKLNFEEESAANKQRKEFFAPLRRAWDVLAYERYEPGSIEEHHSGVLLSRFYQYYREPVIRLSDPLQVEVLDALAEACEIPHKRGQAEIEIPEKRRDYDQWTASGEYQERVAKAQAERRQQGAERYARWQAEPPALQK
jgi:hypothetical protein